MYNNELTKVGARERKRERDWEREREKDRGKERGGEREKGYWWKICVKWNNSPKQNNRHEMLTIAQKSTEYIFKGLMSGFRDIGLSILINPLMAMVKIKKIKSEVDKLKKNCHL